MCMYRQLSYILLLKATRNKCSKARNLFQLAEHLVDLRSNVFTKNKVRRGLKNPPPTPKLLVIGLVCSNIDIKFLPT